MCKDRVFPTFRLERFGLGGSFGLNRSAENVDENRAGETGLVLLV